MSMHSKGQYRCASSGQKLNITRSSEISQTSELLPRRKKHRSAQKKRSNPSNLTREEIKYQRFVDDLKKDIQVCMKQCLRENRFDIRNNQSTETDSTIRLLRTALKSKQTPSPILSHRSNDTGTVISSLRDQQDPMAFVKYNEKKRIAADVEKILTGPAMKDFYTQFIRCSPKEQPHGLFEDSFFNVSEQ